MQKQNKILISLEIIKKAFRFGTLFFFKSPAIGIPLSFSSRVECTFYKASCDALFCDFVSHIEGIALQGSFLPPYEFVFRMDHARIFKGHYMPFIRFCPECRDTVKDFVFVICCFAWSHAIRSKGTGLLPRRL